MLKLVFLFLILLNTAFSQTVIELLPDEDSTVVGEVCFLDLDYPGVTETVCLKAPNNITTPYGLTFPAGLPGAQSCVEVSTGGVISFTGSTCGTGGGTDGADGDVQMSDGTGGHKSINDFTKFESTATSVILQLHNSGSSGADHWQFAAVEGITDHFTINKLGSGGQELRMNTGGDFLVQGSWLPQNEGTQDIGTAALSVGNTFTHLLNTKTLQIENAGETAHYTFDHTASGLFLENTAGSNIIQFGGTEIITHYGTVRPNSAGLTSLGTASNYFNNVWADDFNVEGPHSATPVVHAYEDGGGGRVDIYDDDFLSLPEVVATIGANSSSIGSLELFNDSGGNKLTIDGQVFTFYNDSGNARVAIGHGGDDGQVEVYNSSNNIVAALEATDFIGCSNCGSISLGNSSGTTKLSLLVNSSGDGQLDLDDSSGEVTLTSTSLHFNGNNVTTGTGEGAQLIPISKDGSDHIEADNFSISGDGNFYNRAFSGGDASCTGIDDGWTGIRTDTEEIQICIGGNTRVVALGVP